MCERLSKLDESCFSDTIDIETTTGDCYVGENVWASRLAPSAKKVTCQSNSLMTPCFFVFFFCVASRAGSGNT